MFNQPTAEPDLRYSYQQIGWQPVDASAIVMRLELEGHRVGVLLITATGINQYTSEHASLLLLLHEPLPLPWPILFDI